MNRRILAPGRNCHGVYEAARTGILIDGKNYFRAFYETARSARRYILIAGWQFERSVTLLRGKDLRSADGPARLDLFLNSLCEKNKQLEIFILMWDFSPVVAKDKEWFNKLILDLTANERISFRFDSSHALYASHHQKLVIIDGSSAFVGGLDLSANGWDDRMHWSENSERVLAGEQFEPYHDVQSFHTGPVAWELAKLFQKRWVYAGGAELSLAPSESADNSVHKLLTVGCGKVAISETRAQTLVPLLQPIRQIRQLYLDAIAAAEELIYLETQYFSSQAVYQALRDRMMEKDRPCPEIVMILPKRLHTFFEDLSLSTVQAKMLKSLTEIAARRSCPFGVYYTAAALKSGLPEKTTYIHSKVLLVDDRFLTVGSANATNRSMGMDTELNVSWEADSSDQPDLIRSIRRVRANLLAEHTGLRKLSQRRALGRIDGLVDYLNANADQWGCRLRRHTMESFLEDVSWIRELVPDDLSIDPERPLIEESIYELISRDKNGIFAKGILLLNELAMAQQPGQAGGEKVLSLEVPERMQPVAFARLDSKGNYRWYLVAAIGIAAVAVVWLLFRG